jgi:hypothetical protein
MECVIYVFYRKLFIVSLLEDMGYDTSKDWTIFLNTLTIYFMVKNMRIDSNYNLQIYFNQKTTLTLLSRVASIFIQGFGYDHIKNDFKIIRCIHFTHMSEDDLELANVQREDVPWNEISYEPVWEIYSLRCNPWRKHNIQQFNISPPIRLCGTINWSSENQLPKEFPYI